MKMAKQSIELAADVKSEFAVLDGRRDELEASLRQLIDADAIYRLAACAMLESGELEKDLLECARMHDSSLQLLNALKSLSAKASEDLTRHLIEMFDASDSMVVAALEHGVASAKHRARRDRVKGGQTRWADDPRQNEKAQIKAKWAEWQATPNLYASKTAFAKKMLDDCAYLTSEKHITDLCRDWEKL